MHSTSGESAETISHRYKCSIFLIIAINITTFVVFVADEFVTHSQARANALARSQARANALARSQARANALARFSSHPEKTQLYEEDVEAMEMELDSISNDPSEQDNEPQDQVNKAEVYTEYNEDKNTFETGK